MTRTAIHTVRPDNIATFLGRKLNGNCQDEMGDRFNTRIEGTRIKHTMGPVSVRMKKSIYSLAPMRELLPAANRRCPEFISAIEDDKAGPDKLNKVSQPVEENDRRYRGFNFFDPDEEELFASLGSGGFQNKDPRRRVKGNNTGHVSRMMKRPRTRGPIKKIGRTYKYSPVWESRSSR